MTAAPDARAHLPRRKRAGGKRGGDLFAEALRAMTDQAWARDALGLHLGVSRCAAYNVVDDLHALGLIHVSGRIGHALAFRAGAGVDAAPYRGVPAREMARVFGAIYDAIDKGPVTLQECIEASGRWHRTVADYLTALRRVRLVHIAGYEPRVGVPGPQSPLFALGKDQRDAPRPKPLRRSEWMSNYDNRCKQRQHQLDIQRALHTTSTTPEGASAP